MLVCDKVVEMEIDGICKLYEYHEEKFRGCWSDNQQSVFPSFNLWKWKSTRLKKDIIPAFSTTVPDQFEIVYTARMIAPTGSIHQ